MVEGGPCRCGRGTLYDVLQVSPWCEPEVIQAAYRALARTRHPDVNRDRDAEDQMRRLNVAYQTLSDPIQRARYDEELALESARMVQPRVATPAPADFPRYTVATTPGPASHGTRSPRETVSASSSAASYQAMLFDQRSEGMLSRSALYLMVVLVTVILALMVYIIIDFLATERPISPQRGPRGQMDRPWSSGGAPASWLTESLDAGTGPGLSSSGERWNR
jgi:curved DNA-binding protein CbpA